MTNLFFFASEPVFFRKLCFRQSLRRFFHTQGSDESLLNAKLTETPCANALRPDPNGEHIRIETNRTVRIARAHGCVDDDLIRLEKNPNLETKNVNFLFSFWRLHFKC
jgi:hypothetical protein